MTPFPPSPTATRPHAATRGGADAAISSQLGGVGSNPGHTPLGHESTGAAGNDAGGDHHTRADSLAQSVKRMSGQPGVVKMRGLLYEARHTALAAEFQGGTP